MKLAFASRCTLNLQYRPGCRLLVGLLAACLLMATHGCKEASSPTKPAQASANSSPDRSSTSASSTNGSSDNSKLATDESRSKIRLVDVFDERQISHRYDDGRGDEVYSIVESLGGGVAVADFDNDGESDLIYAGGGRFDKANKRVLGKNGKFYRGIRDWRFSDATQSSWFDCSKFYNHSILTADYDQDGFIDVLVTGYGGLQLFRNQGDGSFQELAQSSGLNDQQWSSGAAWGDVDQDGDLDLYVSHYADWSFEKDPACVDRQGVRDVCGPRDFMGLDHSFYRNLGDGTFADVTKEIGLVGGGRGLCVLAADLDLDGDVEFYVANDEDAKFLYRNDKGRLTEIGVRSGAALDDSGSPDGSMGIALGDYNRDGKQDLFVTHYETETCALYARGLGLNYTHASRRANITSMGNLFVAWGTAFVDFDHDADQDIIIVNGHAIRHSSMAPVDQVPVLLENDNNRSFRKAEGEISDFLTKPRSARGLAIADFNHDGRVDFATSTILQPHSLLKNDSTVQNGLVVRLIGTASPRNPVGAIVRARCGDIAFLQQLASGGSYASSNDWMIHFGIGQAAVIDELEIVWPSGQKTLLKSVAPNRPLVVVEGIGDYVDSRIAFE